MNKLLKLGVVLFGLALAFIAYTDEAKADGPSVRGGQCSGRGACGITAGGTAVIGKWTEVTPNK